MHIPDGYLSPKTCAVFWAGMLPLWYLASRRVERTLKVKELPLLSLAAAFTFVVMMFNIPVPGGSSGHMVGSTVVAIVLGPWAAVVALSLALALQALLFGDGGITTLGANAFNMAVLMSFTGFYVYRTAAFGQAGRKRSFAAAALAGYVAVNAAALAASLELGVQPLIAHDPAGNPLYAPYPPGVTVPAMMLSHLLFFGPVEAAGTALVVTYLYGTERGLVEVSRGVRRGLKPLWVILIVLVVLTPLGLMATATPWGEWGRAEFTELFGFLPEGMERLGEAWQGVLPGYGAGGAGGEEEGFLSRSLLYVLSAAIGSGAVVLTVYILGRIWHRR